MAIRDIGLNFTGSGVWDLGSLGISGTAYAPDYITRPANTPSWDDIGGGHGLFVAINVVESFTSGGAAAIRFDVGLANDNSGGGFYRIGETKSFSMAELTVADGTTNDQGVLNPAAVNAVLIPLKPLDVDLDGSTKGKILSLRAVETAGVALTGGMVEAWVTFAKDTGVQGTKHYHASGFTFP